MLQKDNVTSPTPPIGVSARPLADAPGNALRRHPVRLLGTSWPWRSLAYLASTPVVAGIWLFVSWPALALAGLPLGHIERWRLRWVDHRPIPDPHLPYTSDGLGGWVRLRLSERATWTELLYGVLLIPLSMLSFAVTTVVLLAPAIMIATSTALFVILALGVDPDAVTTVSDLPTSTVNENPIAQLGFVLLGVVLLVAGLYLVTLVAEGQRYLCRLLISEPSIQLTERLVDVTRSRARISSAFDEERRRIERDLHDGAQQRLTSLVMTLGMMRYQLRRGKDIEPLLEQASADAQRAVDELREIVHGIYPSALREHDLAEALNELVSRTEHVGLTTHVQLTVPADLDPDVEVGLYFAISELVTNVTRHSEATTMTLSVAPTPQKTLLVTVEDNGRGGASPDHGTGLVGVVDRIETLGGSVRLHSPAGGPTLVSMEVPCAS
ncbi:sensor histidine kinase [Streptosporangium saharense]|uniref:histidine kinase n=1 Tax=Streptosporangium saharense TaxID=1706840 RepID=A0A7W7VSH3_9ACTN|nr:sensor histidine kinase [Streptosporangium saharense]MBB4920609.1 signal transduction histidine kinase [Streptosporangium saharense]